MYIKAETEVRTGWYSYSCRSLSGVTRSLTLFTLDRCLLRQPSFWCGRSGQRPQTAFCVAGLDDLWPDLYRLRCKHCVSHDSRSSQPSGSLFCCRRWHFRKPALSTNQLKLKVISRSELYFYTLYVSCIMLVYNIVPFV